jgi:hypothetical protein
MTAGACASLVHMRTSTRHPARLVGLSALPVLLFALFAGLPGSAGCGPNKTEEERSVFDRPLAALADSGQVEAMRVVADIEVLRAQGMFPDSLANALMELPASQYMSLDESGVLTRVGRGVDLNSLVDYIAVEPQLLQEMVVTSEQAAELRRLAMENMSAAADMATELRTPKGGPPH